MTAGALAGGYIAPGAFAPCNIFTTINGYDP